MKIEVEPLRTWLTRPEYQPEYLVMKKGLDAKVAFWSKTQGKTVAIAQILNDRCREFRTSTDYGRIWDDLSTNPEMAAREIMKYPDDEFQQHLFCSQWVAIDYLRKLLEPSKERSEEQNAQGTAIALHDKTATGRKISTFLADESMQEHFTRALTRLIDQHYDKASKKFLTGDKNHVEIFLSDYISYVYAACFDQKITSSDATPKSFYKLYEAAWRHSAFAEEPCLSYTNLTRKLKGWKEMCNSTTLKQHPHPLIFDIGTENLAIGQSDLYLEECRDKYSYVLLNAQEVNLFW